MSLRGKLLVASPMLVEPVFYRAVILLLEENRDGAFGIILNRESAESVAEHLPAWSPVTADPGLIHIGGPVEPEAGFALATARAGDDLALPGIAILDLEEDPDSGLGAVRIYSGYSGWSPGQLQTELAEGAWYVVPAAPDDPFGDPAGQWSRVLRRQPGQLAMIASFPEDPLFN